MLILRLLALLYLLSVHIPLRPDPSPLALPYQLGDWQPANCRIYHHPYAPPTCVLEVGGEVVRWVTVEVRQHRIVYLGYSVQGVVMGDLVALYGRPQRGRYSERQACWDGAFAWTTGRITDLRSKVYYLGIGGAGC